VLEIKDLVVVGGQLITFAAVGGLNNFKFIPIIDDINETIRPDQTKIRFYNLDGSNISLNIDTGLLSADLPSGGSTTYTLISPGEYNLQIRTIEQDKHPVNMKINFKPGRIYTLYIIPSVDPYSNNYHNVNIPQIVLTVDGNTLFAKCFWF